MQFESGFVVGLGGFLRIPKMSKVSALVIKNNCCGPFSRLANPGYSLKPRSVVLGSPSILTVLRNCGLTQIAFSVIKAVFVYMVGQFRILESEDDPVHKDLAAPMALRAIGIISKATRSFYYRPIPLREPLKVVHIDDGIVPLRKGDKAIRLTKRLNNRMPFHAEDFPLIVLVNSFGHWLTSVRQCLGLYSTAFPFWLPRASLR
jgi:hypothetical protein